MRGGNRDIDRGFLRFFGNCILKSIWTRSIHSTRSHFISLRFIPMLSPHLHPRFSHSLFPSGFPTKIVYAFLLLEILTKLGRNLHRKPRQCRWCNPAQKRKIKSGMRAIKNCWSNSREEKSRRNCNSIARTNGVTSRQLATLPTSVGISRTPAMPRLPELRTWWLLSDLFVLWLLRMASLMSKSYFNGSYTSERRLTSWHLHLSWWTLNDTASLASLQKD